MPSLNQVIKVMLAVLWTAFIISALIKTPSAIPRFEWLVYPGIDKLIHAILFFVEAALIAWSVGIGFSQKTAIIILIFCAVLGGGLELAQHQFVEGRTGDAIDFLADAFGALLGLWVFQKFNHKD